MAKISLTQGREALVDDEDYCWLSRWTWRWRSPEGGYCAGHQGYAVRSERGRRGTRRQTIYMHRQIMGLPEDREVDHIKPGSGLDNRRANLRIATRAQNARNTGPRRNNTSGYQGVGYEKRTGRWFAQAALDGQRFCLGTYDSPEEASRAYENFRSAHDDMDK